jgi:hypothetical protein
MQKISEIFSFHQSMKAISFILAIFFLLSCEDSLNNTSNIVFPEKNVSFLNHVQPFVKYNCSFQGCHSDETQAGGRRMTDYFSFFEISNLGLVVAGDTLNSRIIQIIEKQNHRTTLRWNLTDNQRAGMKKWVLEGAKMN